MGQTRKFRIGRLILTLSLTLMTIATQVFLMIQIKHYVTAKVVHDVRIAYDAFQSHMYTGHVTTTANGFNRGIEGFFDPKQFDSLDADIQNTVCRIPFSNPPFIFVILMVWTLSCVGELKELYKSAKTLLQVPPVESMELALEQAEDDEGIHSLRVVVLTYFMKAIVAFIAVARLGICCVLLWMGCRWLVATTNFGDLIMNAVALVFVLELKDFLYVILVPTRNKRDLQNTTIDPPKEKEIPNSFAFMGNFLWIPVTILWVYTYIHLFQRVLPGYRWDVKEVCSQWIIERYSLTKIPQHEL